MTHQNGIHQTVGMIRNEDHGAVRWWIDAEPRLRVVDLADAAEQSIQRPLLQASTPAGRLPVKIWQISK
jgi:hypothetical protein